MKLLMTTSTIAALAAMPAFADEPVMDVRAQMEEMGIMATNLIDRRIYMPVSGMQDGEREMAEQDDLMTEMAESVLMVPEDWEMVGDIDDLMVSGAGEITALMVDAGGFLGMGETERTVTMSDIRFVRDSDDEGEFYVLYTGNQRRFEEETAYDPVAWENDGYQRASEIAPYAEQITNDPRMLETRVDWGTVTAENLLGAVVYSQNDEWIGTLSDLSLGEDSRIYGVIIDVGGFLGIGEHAVELPMEQVEIRRTGGNELRAYVSATQEELQAMEGLNDAM